MADVDDDKIFIFERGRLVSLAARYRRTSCMPTPPQRHHRRPQRSLRLPSSFELSSLTNAASATIIRHFHCVESLYGLPEDIGRIVFDVGLRMELFEPGGSEFEELPSEIAHAFIVLAEAFPSVFVDRLDLSGLNCPLLLSALITSLAASVGELRLDQCRLDSVDSALLSAISAMPQLRKVSVRNNGLWDEKIRSLTAGWRYQRHRASNIREIDVRGNKYLSHQCIRFFLNIPTLEKVIMTSTDELVDEFPLRECCKKRWRLKRLSGMPPAFEGSSGWFAEIQRDWTERRYLPSSFVDNTTSIPCLVLLRECPEASNENNKRLRRAFNSCNDFVDEENEILSSYAI